jgi:uncharacterized transporter YbjL
MVRIVCLGLKLTKVKGIGLIVLPTVIVWLLMSLTLGAANPLTIKNP